MAGLEDGVFDQVLPFVTECQGYVDQLLVETSLLTELFALPIESLLSFVGPQCTDEALKSRSNSLKWLFEDSKIQPRQKNGDAADQLCIFLGATAQVDKSLRDLECDVKNQQQKQLGGTDEVRIELLVWKLQETFKAWKRLLRQVKIIYQPLVVAKQTDGLPAIEQGNEDFPHEALQFHKAYLSEQAEPPSSFPETEDLQADNVAVMSQIISETINWVHNAAQWCLFRQRIDIWNGNVKKIQSKKKNVNWSTKMGRGLEEYLVAPIGTMTYEQVLIPRNQLSRKPKTPKGCLDFDPSQMKIREVIFDKIKAIFRLYGAEPIDTPVFELKEVLTGKYGEDQKLIYDLKDQGGEQLGLRYDLTVPFARFCATNNIERIRRYHIGKVYRRDEPQVARGRLREFYQCDVDIAGTYDCMAAEAEILTMLLHLLNTMKPIIGHFKVKLSHRKFLDGMMSLAGVPEAKLRAISSAIDKLDKEEWSTVEKEMCEVKGLAPEVAQKLKEFVTLSGPYKQICLQLRQIPGVESSIALKQAFEELDLLYSSLEFIPDLDNVLVFDTSLARGLDYYTGLIYEAVLCDESNTSLGSIAAGGRYDGLIGLFSGRTIPAVGVSLGIERIFRLVDTKFVVQKSEITSRDVPPRFAHTNKSDVFILSHGDKMIREKLRIASVLRQAGIRVEFSLQDKIKFTRQIQTILDAGIPIGITIGEAELQTGILKIKRFSADGGGEEFEVAAKDIVEKVRCMLSEQHDGSTTIDQVLFACDFKV